MAAFSVVAARMAAIRFGDGVIASEVWWCSLSSSESQPRLVGALHQPQVHVVVTPDLGRVGDRGRRRHPRAAHGVAVVRRQLRVVLLREPVELHGELLVSR